LNALSRISYEAARVSDVAIRANGVGKRYRLGTRARYRSLRDSIAGFLPRLVRGVRDPEPPTFWALSDASFEVRNAEIIGLIGRNGAGKSTLLKILSRITEPTTGEITISGRVGSLLEVGTGFHPELTGRENIFLNGAILGMHRREIALKFDEIVAFSEVEQFLDTPVRHYSSGMYMRLAFAVAAHLEPEILVIDEVLAVGDAAFQKKCMGKMGDVASQGRTIIFVSHNMGAINRLCSSTIWLDKGRIVEQGPTRDIVARYLVSNSSDSGFCEWPEGIANRGVDEFKLFAARIHSDTGAITSTVDMRFPFAVSLDFRLEKPIPQGRVGFMLSTADGTIVFDSYDTDLEAHHGPRQPGDYTVRCEIPGHLLLPGRYLISVGAGMPGVKSLAWIENALSLTVEQTGLIGDVDAPPMGVIRPKLLWERSVRS
jgi:homopolymeric O-antigen transport system ATP-binding protein